VESENGETAWAQWVNTNLVPPSPATCYRALCARDHRFDGRFFVAVKTTGIYCRPICPARTPGESRCEFFASAAEAERAGYRACFRCRPELAPGLAPVDSIPRLVRLASARIEAGYLNEHSIEDLAALVGVSARHLRRAMEEKLGVTPVELAQTRRLALAKQLLHDTALPLGEVAHHAGFASLRRFNALTRSRWGRSPSTVRRSPLIGGKSGAGGPSDMVSLRLDCRPPFDWDALLDFLAARAIPGVEQVAMTGGVREYRRTGALDGHRGWIAIALGRLPHVLQARISLSLAPRLMEVVARLRSTFDLDARPEVIHGHLRSDAVLRPLLAAHRGLRLPGAFDGFELAMRAILGQQVSVAGATTLSGRLAERFGTRLPGGPPGVDRLFPTAERLAQAAVSEIRAIGLPAARARTVLALAEAVASGAVELSSATGDPEQVLVELQRLPGIGPWTAHAVAMRALHWPNAFPAGDLAIRRALAVGSAREAEARASAWQPWRGYAAMHLWRMAGSAT